MPQLQAANENAIVFTESEVSLTGGQTYQGPSRDSGVTPGQVSFFGAFNAFAFSDQACTIRVEVSSNGSVWRRASTDVAIAANGTQYLSVPVVARFHRVIVVNGATPQSAFFCGSSYTAS